MTSALAQARPLSGVQAIRSIAFLTIPVLDVDGARDFYRRALGMELAASDLIPGFDAHCVMRMPSGQFLILTAPQGPDTHDTGVHHAFRVSSSAHAKIAANLAAEKIDIHTYREDRLQEVAENFYFHDRDGNRLQLVRAATAKPGHGVDAVDHSAVLSYDMLWSESFYGDDLKLPVESRVGVRTADHSRARRWAAGEEAMAPGTRRLDKLYMTMGGQNEVPRANMQVYYKAGDSVFGVYLSVTHRQEPPEDQLIGSPRTGFWATHSELERIAATLQKRRRAFQGPIGHPASSPLAESLYCKDTSGNFLEFCVPRQ